MPYMVDKRLSEYEKILGRLRSKVHSAKGYPKPKLSCGDRTLDLVQVYSARKDIFPSRSL